MPFIFSQSEPTLNGIQIAFISQLIIFLEEFSSKASEDYKDARKNNMFFYDYSSESDAAL
jgi:hypothetical protein